MQLHPLAKFFWTKLLDWANLVGLLGVIWTKLKRNLDNIEAKFGQK